MSRNLKDETLLLRDPSIEPTEELLAELMGPVYPAYRQLVDGLKELEIDLTWQFYKDGTAWLAKGPYTWTGPRGGKRELNTLWLSLWDGFFEVNVYFKETQRLDVLALDLDDETRARVESGKQMGKMNTFPVAFDVEGDTLPTGLLQLIAYKKSLG